MGSSFRYVDPTEQRGGHGEKSHIESLKRMLRRTEHRLVFGVLCALGVSAVRFCSEVNNEYASANALMPSA